MKRTITLFMFLPVLCTVQMAYGQGIKKIDLVSAENMIYDQLKGDYTLLIGNVIFQHEEVLLYCDSAYLYDATNNLDAFGTVHIKASDSLNIYGDSLKYDGNTKIAEIHKHVRLIDNQITLTTEHLTYDLKAKTGKYYDGGKIVDPENTLTSKKGFYYSDIKDFFFNDSVVLININYTILSDSLKYNTSSEVSHFYGPTTITSKENYIYCEKGWYNTQKDIAEFTINPLLRNESQSLTGDSIYYNRIKGLGLAYRNVVITDTSRNSVVKGDFVRYDEKNQYSLATGNALFIQIDEQEDSLFLHADTLIGTFDTATHKARILFAFHHVKFFRDDIQGRCDSLIYNYIDSTIRMFYDPVLWTENNQLSADTIIIQICNGLIDKMYLQKAGFVISGDDTTDNRFNQVKGINMTGYFSEGELIKIHVSGNSETIYFMRDADEKKIGINKAIATDLDIYITKSEISSIVFLKKPVATLYPDKDLTVKDLYLKNFRWLEKFRPKIKTDIFNP
ncbi:MAG TPA: OstA-like protein [Bacteroidales bacterium]|nr:OstA-like protein [Bacteroidales bacterium]